MRAGQDNRAKRIFSCLCFNRFMENILEIAKNNQNSAFKIIKELEIESGFKNIGCDVNLVGSLKSGLLMKHLDIDFHIYSDIVSIEKSFSVILKLIKNPAVKNFTFKNSLDTEENCLEWHIFYEDEFKRLWQIDIIHMPKKSKYCGYFEHVTDRISEVLTAEAKNTILQLKYNTPDDIKISGIEYYRAVIEGKVSTFEEFLRWRKEHPANGIIDWCP